MSDLQKKSERAVAFADFESAVEALNQARQQSKEMSERASKLDAEAMELRDAATKEHDRALLAYAHAHKRLTSSMELLERWDGDSAERLLKSSETIQKLQWASS